MRNAMTARLASADTRPSVTSSDSIEAMRKSPRCGAKTRAGPPCCSPAVGGKRRCRMHGGAPGSGAPLGNQNAFKHGRYTEERLARDKLLAQTLRKLKTLIRGENL